MATISASDFRNGVTFEYDGELCQVIEFQHVKPGKGAAFVRSIFMMTVKHITSWIPKHLISSHFLMMRLQTR